MQLKELLDYIYIVITYRVRKEKRKLSFDNAWLMFLALIIPESNNN